MKKIVFGLMLMAAGLTYAMPSYDDVLVVVNDASPQSLEIGAYFKTARNIPDINVCHVSVTDLQAQGKESGGLDGSTSNLSMAERDALIAAVKSHLTVNNLTDKINYIVLTRGIPPFAVDDISYENCSILDLKLLFDLSESATATNIPDIFTYNKYYYYMTTNYNNQTDYKFKKNKYGYYVVSRLDGPGTINVKQMIDNTGAPAYESAKKPIKYLTVTPFFPLAVETEITNRANINIIAPDTKNDVLIGDVGRDVMFGYWNRVSSPPTNSSTRYFAPYYGDINAFYSDSDTHTWFPNIYYDMTFLPGSVFTCFRSYPSKYNDRMYGGLFALNPASAVVTSYRKADGSDFKFRNMGCVEYDPINNWVWCGAADDILNKVKGVTSSGSTVSGETLRRHDMQRGSGIAVFDSNGNILKHFTSSNSLLLNNRVQKISYDKYAKRVWVAHYKGIQYYDLVRKTWNTVPELTNDFAVACDIYVDPYDTDKVYFSFYSTEYYKSVTSSKIAGADTTVFEYSKGAKTVKPYMIDSSVKGRYPKLGKTATNILWVTKSATVAASLTSYTNYLYKYNLTSSSVVEKIDLGTTIPDVLANPTNSTYTLNCPTAITAVPGTNVLLIPITCQFFTDLKRYVLRVSDNGAATSTVQAISIGTTAGASRQEIWSLVGDPSNSNKFYLSSSGVNPTGDDALLKSTDQGKTWSAQSATSGGIVNIRGITVGPTGTVYGVRGYNFGQQNFSDFQAFGLCGWSGGLSHQGYLYNAHPAAAPSGGTVTSSPVYSSSDSDAEAQSYSMMFMLLDGYYTGEARFSIFRRYPASGGGGYVAHMLVFEPKCAPYAPRVDEVNMNQIISDGQTIEVPLRSPGLPEAMDGFIAATVNTNTVTVTTGSGTPITPSSISYNPAGRKVVITGNFTGTTYKVTLKCGADGIKNVKRASLTNTRPAEFKDEVTYVFGAASSLATDLSVTNLVFSPAIPDLYMSLKLTFKISNSGNRIASAGASTNQTADIYLDGVKIDSVSYDDIESFGSTTLTYTIPAAKMTGGTHVVKIVADAGSQIAETDESASGNSVSSNFTIVTPDSSPNRLIFSIFSR